MAYMIEAALLKEEAQAGGKAFQLQVLSEKGFRVPRFCCVSAQCFSEQFVKGKENAPLQKEIEDFLDLYFPQTNVFSVRSSAIGEDAVNASYAGQFKTLLRVPKHALYDAVWACYEASSSAEHIEHYQREKGIESRDFSMGVIIQEMIEAELSGVAFSSNPQGLLNEAVVVCGASTGDHVVEDQVPIVTYYYHRQDTLFYCERQEGAPELPQAITEELIEALQILGEDVPVDIEYAVYGGILYFLQCRPITTLFSDSPLVLDNSNIVESYPGLSLPLTASFVEYVYYQVFSGVARRCLPGKKLLKEYDSVLRRMVACANGRMYYQISNWYTILKFLPFQKKIIPVWQQMLGVKNKGYDALKNKVTLSQKIFSYTKIAKNAFGIPGKMEKLHQDFLTIEKWFEKEYSSSASNQELLRLYEGLARAVVKDWDITLLNDMYAFLYTGLLQRHLKKQGYEDHKEKSNLFLSNIGNIESMKPIREALALAKTLSADENLLMRLQSLKNDEDTEKYLKEATPFSQQIKEYLSKYGDRCLEELKLETKTFKSAPFTFIELLLTYASDEKVLSKNIDAFSLTTGQDEDTMLRIKRGRKRLLFFSKRAAKGISNREISRLDRCRIFGIVRTIFEKMGENLAAENKMDEPTDVLYLRQEELFSYIKGEDDGNQFRKQIAKRKKEYEGFSFLPSYSRLIFSKEIFDKHPIIEGYLKESISERQFQGIPCSGGVVSGEVLVVENPKEIGETRGKILVTKMTDPGWVFLLAVSKGIIAEKGSLLSHTAIISRELGVPSVVGIPDITRHLKTGDMVRMDGGTGYVEIL